MDARKFDGSSHGCTEVDGRLHMHLLDLPLIFVNFPCMYRTIRQFQVLREDFPSSNGAITAFSSTSSVSTRPSCNFWCGNNTFHQFPVWRWHFPSTSGAAVALPVCRLELTSPSVHRRDLLSISSASTVLSFPSCAPLVWRRHLWCGGVTYVAAALPM